MNFPFAMGLICLGCVAVNIPGMMNGNGFSFAAAVFCAACAGLNFWLAAQ